MDQLLKVHIQYKQYLEIHSITSRTHCTRLHNIEFNLKMPFISADESFAISHYKRGMLGMASKGPHTNGSQFYITLQPTHWMDKTYVAFGFA